VHLVSLCICTGKIAGTETTNGDEVTVTADVNSIKGTAPAGSEIDIFSDDYFPFIDSGFTNNAIVNSTGSFQFFNLQPGSYNILCTYPKSDASVFVQKISVQTWDRPQTDTVTLTITGAIKGSLLDSLNKPVKNAYAYIKGSPFYAATNELGEFALNKIPDGMYTVIFKRTDTNSNSIKGPPVSVSVDVTAGKATEIEPVTYK
jgi:hypothetical protein